MKKILILLITLTAFAVAAHAQVDIVQVIVSENGPTKSQAVDNCLRKAIEQSFGTFVSSNTTILNDELVKDEIVSISSGNIKKYEEISSLVLPNGEYSVTLNVTVSVNKLADYAKSHGSSCELNGALIGANLRLERFYEENEKIVLENLYRQMELMPDNLFDINIAVDKTTVREISVSLSFLANQNYQALNELFFRTLAAIGLTDSAVEAREALGLKVFRTDFVTGHIDKPGQSRSWRFLHVYTRTIVDKRRFLYLVYHKINAFRVSSNIDSPVKYPVDECGGKEQLFGFVRKSTSIPAVAFFYDGQLIGEKNNSLIYSYQGHPLLFYFDSNYYCDDIWNFPTNPMYGSFYGMRKASLNSNVNCKFKNKVGKEFGIVQYKYNIKESDLTALTNLFIEPL